MANFIISNIFENLLTQKINVDLINDYIETEPNTVHSARLIKSMNQGEHDLAEAMASIRMLIVAANGVGINFYFSIEPTSNHQTKRQKIKISITNWAIAKYGTKVATMAADAVNLLIRWIAVLNSYNTYTIGVNEITYLKSMENFKFSKDVKISCC